MAENQVTNRILSVLPAPAWERLLPKLTTVSLTHQQMLTRANEPIDKVYFPLSGWISIIVHINEGYVGEVGLVGREGMIGLATYGAMSSFDHLVQGPGHALSVSKSTFDAELRENEPLSLLLARYQEVLYAQTAVTAACNGWHDLEQRFARWLLAAHDRSDSDDLPLTQEFLAMMLCVHRPRVTVIARSLQATGMISYNRGHITIRDRDALESTACECYRTMRDQMEGIFR